MSVASALVKATEEQFVYCLDLGLDQVGSDPGHPFHPFVTTFTKDSEIHTQVLVADHVSRSILMSSGAIQERSSTAVKYGLVWDGYITVEGKKSDCIYIEYATNSINTVSEVFCQPYKVDDNKSATRAGEIVHYDEWTNRFLTHSGIGLLNKLDWDLLVRSPLIVLCAVAAESGEVNEGSMEKIVAYLKREHSVESQSLRLAIEDCVKNHERIIGGGFIGHDVLSQLQKTRETIGWYSQDKGLAFCKGLYELGKKYSESSGSDNGGVLPKLKGALT